MAETHGGFAASGPPWLRGKAAAIAAFGPRVTLLGACSFTAVALYALLLPALGFAPQGSLPLLAVFVGALVAAIAGFAFSPICGVLLFHTLNTPASVVEILLLCSIANQMLSVVALWRDIAWRPMVPFMVSGVLGVPLGLFLLLHSNPHTYQRVFGSGLIAYSTWLLARHAFGGGRLAGASRTGDWIAGFTGGIGSGFAGFAGGALVIWFGMQGWDKVRQRAIYQPFILAMQILSLSLLLAMGKGHDAVRASDLALLDYLPVSLLGTWCGLRIFRSMTDRQFGTAINLLLIVSGVGLVV